VLTDDEVRAKIATASWYHTFELRPGIVTPGRGGRTESRRMLSDSYGLPDDLSGLTALDIGALDGPHTIELARRGADVTALDVLDFPETGLKVALEITGARAEFVLGDVYDLAQLLPTRQFDIILFMGVWYHLKHPLLALERVYDALKPDGLMLYEGEVLHHYAEAPGRTPEELRDEVERLASSELPICTFYSEGCRGDRTNWNVPNRACVQQWMNAASFDVETMALWAPWPYQRLYGRARKRAKAPRSERDRSL
jgi:tRNA (mo5U34)-methyltransferase